MLPAEEAMRMAEASYLEDLEAGFNLIHIDPTKDPHCSGAVPMNIVLERTVELMEYVEEQAQRLGLSDISYEVGTEETAGGLISAEAFEQFIAELLQELNERHLHHPAFIVGQTGTLVRMDRNVGHFDADNTRRLCQIARKYGIGFKEHNADYLPLDALEMHPELGITGANVAPEFGLVETRSLLKLSAQEREAISKVCIEPSDFASVIQQAALKSGRWKKWLVKEDVHLTEEEIAENPEKLAEVTDVCGHYVFNQPDVQRAREKLYDNLVALRITDSPETVVVEDVKASIKRYIDVLNLEGINSRL
jgi:tagatose-1,6-bisphosphate aldolase non-catalytic subunit AgaZ/GatZ